MLPTSYLLNFLVFSYGQKNAKNRSVVDRTIFMLDSSLNIDMAFCAFQIMRCRRLTSCAVTINNGCWVYPHHVSRMRAKLESRLWCPYSFFALPVHCVKWPSRVHTTSAFSARLIAAPLYNARFSARAVQIPTYVIFRTPRAFTWPARHDRTAPTTLLPQRNH